MEIKTFLQKLTGIEDDLRSAFIRVQVNSLDQFFIVDVMNDVIERLKLLSDPTILEFQDLMQILKLLITHLPDSYRTQSESYRKALAKPLGATASLTQCPFRFIAVKKLILIDLEDPLPTCKLVCRAIDLGAPLDDLVYEVLLPYLRNTMFDDVDLVMKFLTSLRDAYGGNTGVDHFLEQVEKDLKIRGLAQVWGPSLRRDYARMIIKPNVIDKKTSILIVGPTGTSKTFIAEKIAANSAYPTFMKVNSAGKNVETDLEAALASAATIPTTIFLDEVYAIPLKTQEACLVEFNRSDLSFRIISASSDPIEVLSTKLKADFLARIKGWTLQLKPIADNPSDVEEAIRGLAERYHMDMADGVVEHLRDNHTWPHNHRELEQVVQALCMHCQADGAGEVNVDVLLAIRSTLDDSIVKILEPLI
jgi:hypothetical protein